MLENLIENLNVLLIPIFFWLVKLDRRQTRTEEKVHFLYKKNGGKKLK